MKKLKIVFCSLFSYAIMCLLKKAQANLLALRGSMGGYYVII